MTGSEPQHRRPLRILFAFAGGAGHFGPIAPIARAARAAGHTVAVTGRHALLDTVRGAGFTAYPSSHEAQTHADWGPLRLEDRDTAEREFRRAFAGWLGRGRADGMLALGTQWRPDLIVCDEADFGAMIAAERLGLPYATVQVFASGSFVRGPRLAADLDALRAGYGLPPDPDLAMPRRYLVLSPLPPSLRDPAHPQPPTVHPIRPADADLPRPGRLAWPVPRLQAPTVYVTLGTAFNVHSGDLFARMLTAMRDMPVNALVTVGRQLDPASFGSQPPHVHVTRYIPLADVLPYCDAVVSHGGAGTVVAALARGLPQVAIPIGADQPDNARRLADLGAGVQLDATAADPDAVRSAVARVLAEPGYRRAAERVQEEIAAMPDTAHAVPLLERVAESRAPVVYSGVTG